MRGPTPFLTRHRRSGTRGLWGCRGVQGIQGKGRLIWLLAWLRVPQALVDAMAGWGTGVATTGCIVALAFLFVGMFIDAIPAIIILGPILGPIFVDLGVHPVHFAIIMSVNLTVGLATPPMGLVLFVASSVSGERVETISRAILPFLAVEVLVIFLITYVPAISMTIPRLTGFVH